MPGKDVRDTLRQTLLANESSISQDHPDLGIPTKLTVWDQPVGITAPVQTL